MSQPNQAPQYITVTTEQLAQLVNQQAMAHHQQVLAQQRHQNAVEAYLQACFLQQQQQQQQQIALQQQQQQAMALQQNVAALQQLLLSGRVPAAQMQQPQFSPAPDALYHAQRALSHPMPSAQNPGASHHHMVVMPQYGQQQPQQLLEHQIALAIQQQHQLQQQQHQQLQLAQLQQQHHHHGLPAGAAAPFMHHAPVASQLAPAQLLVATQQQQQQPTQQQHPPLALPPVWAPHGESPLAAPIRAAASSQQLNANTPDGQPPASPRSLESSADDLRSDDQDEGAAADRQVEAKVDASAATQQVYAPGFKSVLTIPAKAIRHLPPANLNVTRLVLCANYDPMSPEGSCPMGDRCKFVHADATAADEHAIHVNYAWRSLEDVSYERFPAGQTLRVALPNSKPVAEALPSQAVLKTRCLQSTRRPLSHCAHYYFNRTCNLGAECRFVHAVYIDPTAKPHQRAPVPSLRNTPASRMPTASADVSPSSPCPSEVHHPASAAELLNSTSFAAIQQPNSAAALTPPKDYTASTSAVSTTSFALLRQVGLGYPNGAPSIMDQVFTTSTDSLHEASHTPPHTESLSQSLKPFVSPLNWGTTLDHRPGAPPPNDSAAAVVTSMLASVDVDGE